MEGIESVDLSKITAQDYLKNGFFDHNGDLVEGLNGYYSLAIAYKLRDETSSPDAVKSVFDKLVQAASKYYTGPNDQSVNQPLDSATLNEVHKIQETSEVKASPTLLALFQSAESHLKTAGDLGAFVVHLERILAQLALVSAAPR
jgi:hypothetical protein